MEKIRFRDEKNSDPGQISRIRNTALPIIFGSDSELFYSISDLREILLKYTYYYVQKEMILVVGLKRPTGQIRSARE
jgi:hypothetical protein